MKNKSLFKQFEEITDEMLALNPSDENIISLLEEKLKVRAEIIEKIEQIGEENPDKEDINRLLQKNEALKVRLSEIKLKIGSTIQDVQFEKSLSAKKKKAQRGYLNPGYQKDGYFIDKKK